MIDKWEEHNIKALHILVTPVNFFSYQWAFKLLYLANIKQEKKVQDQILP